jgi:hypothetical protein
MSGFIILKEKSSYYFKLTKLCSIVAILESASASFCHWYLSKLTLAYLKKEHFLHVIVKLGVSDE